MNHFYKSFLQKLWIQYHPLFELDQIFLPHSFLIRINQLRFYDSRHAEKQNLTSALAPTVSISLDLLSG